MEPEVQPATPGSCLAAAEKNVSELRWLVPRPLVTQHQADPEHFLLQAGGGDVPGVGNIPQQPEPAGQSCPMPGSSFCPPELLLWANAVPEGKKLHQES